MNDLGSHGKRFAATIALIAAAVLARPGQAVAIENWLRGTATASAHDKALAHELAYEQVVQELLKQCSGTMAGPVEEKVSYDYLASSDEWSSTVTVRALCDFSDDSR